MATSMGGAAQPEVTLSYGSTVAVSFVGWPNITGLTVMSGGSVVTPRNGVYTVRDHANITVLAAGIELATLAAKPNITLFNLISTHDCGSSNELGKLVSLLLALDSDWVCLGLPLPVLLRSEFIRPKWVPPVPARLQPSFP